ncbi:hypothetical protein MRX96_008062 [Rhipicephalus microplus]
MTLALTRRTRRECRRRRPRRESRMLEPNKVYSLSSSSEHGEQDRHTHGSLCCSNDDGTMMMDDFRSLVCLALNSGAALPRTSKKLPRAVVYVLFASVVTPVKV